jgi:hypothetical protein
VALDEAGEPLDARERVGDARAVQRIDEAGRERQRRPSRSGRLRSTSLQSLRSHDAARRVDKPGFRESIGKCRIAL